MARSVRFEARGPILGTCPWNSTHQLKSVGNDCDGGGKTTWRRSGLKSVDGQHGSSAHTLSGPGPRPLPPWERENRRTEGRKGVGPRRGGDGGDIFAARLRVPSELHSPHTASAGIDGR